MEDLIERFLLMNKYCPLPEIGTLELRESMACIVPGENIITAPLQTIILEKNIKDTASFTAYISRVTKVDRTVAFNNLLAFCSAFGSLDGKNELKLGRIGIISKANSEFSLKQFAIPEELLPAIRLKRVVHPNNVHKVRVGEDERTNVFMSEFLDKTRSEKNIHRWIFAAILTLIAIGLIVFYFFNEKGNSAFGDSSPIQVNVEQKHYELIQ